MIEELRRFILVVKNGNLTKTAEQIFITQSALTQSIQRLEKELKIKLFIRKAKTLSITKEGTAIVEIGTKIIELWDKAKNPQSTTIDQPTYAIGLFDSAALLLGKYFMQNAQNKLFNLELTIDTSAKLLSKLELGILDAVVLVIDRNHQLSKDIVLVKTFSEKLIPVAGAKFKDIIQKIPFILYNKGSNTRSQIDEEFTKRGIVPNVIAESTSTPFMKELATLGGGVAILPESIIQTEIKQGILKKQKLSVSFKREYGIYINKYGQLQKDHQLIKDLIGNLS